MRALPHSICLEAKTRNVLEASGNWYDPGASQLYRAGKLSAGAYGEVKKTIYMKDVRAYADLLGDDNPVHLDEAFAATSRFGRPIAHGMIASGLIPTVFGAEIPGSLYVSQLLRFRKPVYVGDEVVARVTVKWIRATSGTRVTGTGAGTKGSGGEESEMKQQREAALLVTCDTVVTRPSDGAIVIDGEATVLLPGYAP